MVSGLFGQVSGRNQYLTPREKLHLRLKHLEFRSPVLATNKLVLQLLTDDPFLQSLQSSEGKEIIFVHVPKTAGTSVATMLGRKALHVPLSRYYAWDEERAAAAWKFAVVRDPAERLQSAYNYLFSAIGINESLDVRWATEVLSGVETFEDFLEKMFNPSFKSRVMTWTHFRPQVHWLRVTPRQGVTLDRVFRFETIEDSIEELGRELGYKLELPHLRVPRRKRVTKPLLDRHRELIHQIYLEDYKAFGYEV